MARISIIAALGANRAIGKGNKLLWRIPDDLRRFKQLTLGHPVIMGRKTFESVLRHLGKPLPNRTNVVLSRTVSSIHHMLDLVGPSLEEAVISSTFEDAIEKAEELDNEEIFIGGGAQVYEQTLPLVDRLYLTLIEDEKEGDSYFPDYEHLFKTVVEDEPREWQGLEYRWLTLDRN